MNDLFIFEGGLVFKFWRFQNSDVGFIELSDTIKAWAKRPQNGFTVSNPLVSQEFVFDNLLDKDKLVYMFNLDTISGLGIINVTHLLKEWK